MFQGLTTLLKVMAVPAIKTRSQTLGRRLNSMELAVSNLVQMPRKWWINCYINSANVKYITTLGNTARWWENIQNF
jgi:hypothetical protein